MFDLQNYLSSPKVTSHAALKVTKEETNSDIMKEGNEMKSMREQELPGSPG